MTKQNGKKKFSFPSAYVVLFIVMIIAVILTYAIPAGEYSKLTYDEDADVFVITSPDGEVEELEAYSTEQCKFFFKYLVLSEKSSKFATRNGNGL